MPASVVTWLNKIDGFDLSNPQKNVNASDMNQIKSSINANAALHDSLAESVIENEVPSGTINGINNTFSILNSAIAGSTKLYQNGIRLRSGGIDYTHSGTTLTFVTPPETGDILLIDYRK